MTYLDPELPGQHASEHPKFAKVVLYYCFNKPALQKKGISMTIELPLWLIYTVIGLANIPVVYITTIGADIWYVMKK